MKLLPSVLNYSYHRQFAGRWVETLDEYLGKVDTLRKKYGFDKMGINVAIAGDQDVVKTHNSENLMEIKKKLEDKNFHPIVNLGKIAVHSDKEIVRQGVEEIKKAIEEAVVLGAKTAQLSATIWGRLTKEKALRIYTDMLKEIGACAKDHGLIVGSENYCTFSGDELILAVENCGQENVAYLNDTGNWLILGEDPVAATRKIARKTVHMHLKDYILKDGIWTSVSLGKGIVDLHAILRIMQETPGDRTVYMAFETDLDDGDEDQAMDECFQYARSWFDRN